MPHRLNEFRSKIQFVSFARMPRLINIAAEKTGCLTPAGKPSNTVYIQRALCRALSRDLGLDYEELLEDLPKPTGRAAAGPPRRHSASAN